MKKLVTIIALAASVSTAALITAGPAAAALHHHQHERALHSGPGHYEGNYEYRIDRGDHASSPYAGGVG